MWICRFPLNWQLIDLQRAHPAGLEPATVRLEGVLPSNLTHDYQSLKSEDSGDSESSGLLGAP
jgi:hypothetical protein